MVSQRTVLIGPDAVFDLSLSGSRAWLEDSGIRFAKVAIATEGLEGFKRGLTSVAPRGDVVHVEFDACLGCGTKATAATSEAVALKNLPAQTK